jgi:hypothetical protein
VRWSLTVEVDIMTKVNVTLRQKSTAESSLDCMREGSFTDMLT